MNEVQVVDFLTGKGVAKEEAMEVSGVESLQVAQTTCGVQCHQRLCLTSPAAA